MNNMLLIMLAGLLLGITLGLLFRKKSLQGTQNTESKLHEYEKCFETIFDNTNIGMALLNLEGKLLKANQSLCEFLGYTETDILALNFHHLIHPNDASNLKINTQELINNKIKKYQSEQQCYRKNGEAICILSSLSLIAIIKKNHSILLSKYKISPCKKRLKNSSIT